MSKETQNKFSFLQIPDEWEPTDEEASLQRALFLCHAVDGQLRQNITQLIAKYKSGEFGKAVQVAAQRNITDWMQASAIKQSTCICIHRSWLEQGGAEAPAWLLDYVVTSYSEAEELCERPEASEILLEFEESSMDEIIPELVDKLVNDFGISVHSEAAEMLESVLESAALLARELLYLSLTQPMESLHRHLLIYQR